jgi:hypothetical protein
MLKKPVWRERERGNKKEKNMRVAFKGRSENHVEHETKEKMCVDLGEG